MNFTSLFRTWCSFTCMCLAFNVHIYIYQFLISLGIEPMVLLVLHATFWATGKTMFMFSSMIWEWSKSILGIIVYKNIWPEELTRSMSRNSTFDNLPRNNAETKLKNDLFYIIMYISLFSFFLLKSFSVFSLTIFISQCCHCRSADD